ncbi:MAG: hypothetical protein U0931_13285 [Vulcanimicrobiota bacterium]
MRRRGVALIVVLMASMALTVILASLVQLARNQAFDSLDRERRAILNCLLQSGVAHAQSQLAHDYDFQAHQFGQVQGLQGSYEINYYNNLNGQQPIEGPGGQVKPGLAEVVVTARAAGTSQKADVLIGFGGDDMPFGVAGSGRINIIGACQIRTSQWLGDRATINPSKAQAGLHSNYDGDPTHSAIRWSSSGSDIPRVDGVVSTFSTAGNAVDFGKFNDSLKIQKGAGKRPLPTANFDLPEKGTPLPAPVRGVGLTLDKATYRNDGLGGLSVAGDLELDDSILYVDGNLDVAGSISGTGTIYVTGTTKFEGDSRLDTNDTGKGLAICSQDSVSLQGFDADSYISKASPDSAAAWSKVQADFTKIQGIPDGSVASRLASLQQYSADARSDLQTVKASLEALDPNTNGFRSKALRRVNSLLGWFEEAPASQDPLKRLDRGGELSKGVFYAVANMNPGDPEAANRLSRLHDGFSANSSSKVRSNSVFTGIIYTQGVLYASNNVHIRGALWANSDPGGGHSLVAGGTTYQPGDVVLDDGVSVNYSAKLAENFVKNLPAAERRTGVKAWLEI